MPEGKRRGYHTVTLGRTQFHVDVRYMNLKPIGKGAYGLVASADDLVWHPMPQALSSLLASVLTPAMCCALYFLCGTFDVFPPSTVSPSPPSSPYCPPFPLFPLLQCQITGRKVAIKKVSRVFQDLIDAKRILRELKLLRHLGHHDNIIEIVDIMTGPPETEDFDTLYIVTDWYECDLERIITSKQALTDQHVQYFVFQLLRGLKFIHSAHVLHRDLKPSNLLVNSNCDLAICDFGLARGVSTEVCGASRHSPFLLPATPLSSSFRISDGLQTHRVCGDPLVPRPRAAV